MADSSILKLRAFLTVLASVGCLSTSALAQSYPPCPMTNKPPRKTTNPFTRCLDANQYTCCEDCIDISLSVFGVSLNGSAVLAKLSPSVSSLLGTESGGKDFKFCSATGANECGDLLEQMNCALYCNPDAGTYLNTTGDDETLRGTVKVCNTFAQLLYDTCGNVTSASLPPGVLRALIPTPEKFLSIIYGRLTKYAGAGSYTVDIVPDGQACYAGPKQTPAVPVCCDRFNIPDYCPASTANFTKYPAEREVVNRTVDPVACAAYLSAPTPAPAASSPTAAVNGTPTASNSTSPAAAVNATTPAPNSSSPTPSSTPSPPKSAASIVQGLGIAFWAAVFVVFSI